MLMGVVDTASRCAGLENTYRVLAALPVISTASPVLHPPHATYV